MDIPVIARAILHSVMEAYGKQVSGFSEEALACMCEYHWPGNVRELENEVRRMLVMSTGNELGANLLSSRVLKGAVTVSWKMNCSQMWKAT